MSYTSEKFNVAMSALRKIHDQDLERMNTDWAKLREKKDKQLPKMLKEAKKEATASLKIENTKLKEEIKILKEERKDIPMTELEQLKISHTVLRNSYNVQIKELKEQLLHQCQKGSSIDTEAMDELVNIFDEEVASCDIPEAVKELKKEISSLNETILARDEEIGDIKENVFPGYDDDIKELKEENEHLKLKEEGFDNVLKVRSSLAKGEIHHRDEEIKKLKEEIKELKELKVKEFIEKSKAHLRTLEIEDELMDIFDEEVESCDIPEAVKDLKEENEKLKKYESMVHCVWSDVYWADKYNSDVSFKDIACSSNYYDHKEFIMKEVIDDEQD